MKNWTETNKPPPKPFCHMYNETVCEFWFGFIRLGRASASFLTGVAKSCVENQTLLYTFGMQQHPELKGITTKIFCQLEGCWNCNNSNFLWLQLQYKVGNELPSKNLILYIIDDRWNMIILWKTCWKWNLNCYLQFRLVQQHSILCTEPLIKCGSCNLQ